MNHINWFLKVYWQHVKAEFRSAAAYPTNFIFSVIMSIIANCLLPLSTLLLYVANASFPGWTMYEALLVQSCFTLCCGLCAPLLYRMVWVTMNHVKQGTYDLLLLKPGSTILLTVAKSFELENVGVMLGGILLFIFSASNIKGIQPVGWIGLVAFLLCGLLFASGLVFIMAATTFKWVGNSRIFEIYDSLTILGRYPGTIYHKLLMNITTFVFPVAAMGFFPAASLLGRSQPWMYWEFMPALLFFLLGLWLFRKMIRLYQSAGG